MFKEAIVFNAAIKQVMEFSNAFLTPKGFTASEIIEPQEDSGDLVSSESLTLTYINHSLNLELRFFLCCGKGHHADAITLRGRSLTHPDRFVDFSRLSELSGFGLHQLDFNVGRKPVIGFFEDYLQELRITFDILLEQAQRDLADSVPTEPAVFRIF
jgi:hypothetical protein